MRYFKIAVCGLVVIVSTFATAYAAKEKNHTRVIQRESMEFRKCLGRISSMSTKLGIIPKSIFRTNNIRIVLFDAQNGKAKVSGVDEVSLLVSCTGSNDIMQINEIW